MTPITRQQQREIWQHFLTNVIQARTTATDTQSELEKAMAFEGFDAWDDIYSVVDATFIWNLQTEITVGEGTRTRRNPNAPSAPIHPLNNPVTDWDKGVKRDMTLFPAIKTDTQFDNWNRETLAVAAAQNVSDVFDPNYVPPVAGNNLLLWERQQKFVYAMFNKTIDTNTVTAAARRPAHHNHTTHEITQFYDFVFTNMGSFTKGDRIKPIRGQHKGRIAIIRNVGLVKLSVTFEDGRPGMYVSKAHAQVITSEKTTPDTEGIQFARANVVEPDIDELATTLEHLVLASVSAMKMVPDGGRKQAMNTFIDTIRNRVEATP